MSLEFALLKRKLVNPIQSTWMPSWDVDPPIEGGRDTKVMNAQARHSMYFHYKQMHDLIDEVEHEVKYLGWWARLLLKLKLQRKEPLPKRRKCDCPH